MRQISFFFCTPKPPWRSWPSLQRQHSFQQWISIKLVDNFHKSFKKWTSLPHNIPHYPRILPQSTKIPQRRIWISHKIIRSNHRFLSHRLLWITTHSIQYIHTTFLKLRVRNTISLRLPTFGEGIQTQQNCYIQTCQIIRCSRSRLCLTQSIKTNSHVWTR